MSGQGDLFDIPEAEENEDIPEHLRGDRRGDYFRFSMTEQEMVEAARGKLPDRIRRACWMGVPHLTGDWAEWQRRSDIGRTPWIDLVMRGAELDDDPESFWLDIGRPDADDCAT